MMQVSKFSKNLENFQLDFTHKDFKYYTYNILIILFSIFATSCTITPKIQKKNVKVHTTYTSHHKRPL